MKDTHLTIHNGNSVTVEWEGRNVLRKCYRRDVMEVGAEEAFEVGGLLLRKNVSEIMSSYSSKRERMNREPRCFLHGYPVNR